MFWNGFPAILCSQMTQKMLSPAQLTQEQQPQVSIHYCQGSAGHGCLHLEMQAGRGTCQDKVVISPLCAAVAPQAAATRSSSESIATQSTPSVPED